MPVNPRTQEAEAGRSYEFETSLGYIARTCLKNKTSQKANIKLPRLESWVITLAYYLHHKDFFFCKVACCSRKINELLYEVHSSVDGEQYTAIAHAPALTLFCLCQEGRTLIKTTIQACDKRVPC
jgi:hypothetical protein